MVQGDRTNNKIERMQRTLQSLMPATKLPPDVLISQLHRRLDDFVKQALRLDKSLHLSRIKRRMQRQQREQLEQEKSKYINQTTVFPFKFCMDIAFMTFYADIMKIARGKMSGSVITTLARAAKKARHDKKMAAQKKRKTSRPTKKGKKSRYVGYFEAQTFWNDDDEAALSSNEKPEDKEDPKSVFVEISSESEESDIDLHISSESEVSDDDAAQTWMGCLYWEKNFPSHYSKNYSRSSRSTSRRMSGPKSLVILKQHMKTYGIYIFFCFTNNIVLYYILIQSFKMQD